jgi:hypothetical protein
MPDFNCSVFTAAFVRLANATRKTTGNGFVNFLKRDRISIFRKDLMSYFYDGIYHGIVAI